jgi:hypothetical protein
MRLAYLPIAGMIFLQVLRGIAQDARSAVNGAEVGTQNILSFGADRSGMTDSSASFEKLMRKVGNDRHIKIILPPGSYRLNSRVVLRAAGNNSYYGLHLQGAGENVTELIVDNEEGGVAFEGRGISRLSVIISDLAIVAARSDAGTALSFDIPNPGVENMRQFNVRNVSIRGTRFDQGFFNRGVYVRNAWYALLQNVNITQQYESGLGVDKYAMEYGFLLEDCYSPSIIDCRVANGRYGLVQRAQKTFPEDGIIRGSYFVGNVECIVLDFNKSEGDWAEPGFHIDNCHINYRDRGIVVRGLRQANISQSLFYCHDRSGTRWFRNEFAEVPGGDEKKRREYEPRDIDLDLSSDIIINSNIFTEPANSGRVGVRIGPQAGHILISANQFNMSGVAIKNESREPSYAIGNIFTGRPGWHKGLEHYLDVAESLQHYDFDQKEKMRNSDDDK